MRIRTRLTLWYAGILSVSAVAIGAASFQHFQAERRAEKRSAGVEEFLRDELENWDDVLAIGLWCGLPAAVVGLGGGWLLTRQALAPVVRLTAATEIEATPATAKVPKGAAWV